MTPQNLTRRCCEKISIKNFLKLETYILMACLFKKSVVSLKFCPSEFWHEKRVGVACFLLANELP